MSTSTRLDSSGSSLEITCNGCNATNRVPLRRLSDRPVCGRCRQLLVVDRPVEVSDATFDPLVREAAVPVLVDFWAPWCGPCRMVAPELEKLASQKQGELLIAKLNSDENPQTSSRYNVRSIPTLVLFRAGQEQRRLLGAMPAPQIVTQLGL
jgi:thioredoxin 2